MNYLTQSGRHAFLVALGIPIASLFFNPDCLATTSPRPGTHAPEHVRQHASRSQVSFDTPGAWRAKARDAKKNREDVTKRGGASDAVTGVLEVPVLCFGFNNINLPANTVPNLQQELFDGPWPTGTLSDYYREISYGQFTFDGDVVNIGNLSSNDTIYEAGVNGLSSAPFTYVNEALNLADANIDFSVYDNDGPDGIPNSGDDDGIVDLVALVHPETGGECGNGNLWSHRWNYASANSVANGTPALFSTNDAAAGGGFIRINDYTIMPAVSCGGTLIEIGVFCHEFGHALGLPDLYGTGGSSNEGCGHFCLMASGNWNSPSSPAHMSAWCRAEMGWIEPQLVIGDFSNLSIPAIETTPFALKIKNDPDSSEYLLIENRQPLGFDQNLWGCGLAIWHVDPSVSTGNNFGWCNGVPNAAHSMIALEQADAFCDLETSANRGDVDDLYSLATVSDFDSNTVPSSRPYSNVDTGVKISNISDCGLPMTVDLTVRPLPIDETRELDVLFIFDTSGSYWDDLPNMLAQMPSVMSMIGSNFPNPRYGVASFTDFPIAPSGSNGDVAWAVSQDFTSNPGLVTAALGALTAGGGSDLPESQYEALYQAMMGTGLDLNNDNDFNDLGEIAPQPLSWDSNRAPIIFLMTDADFHDADLEDYPSGTGEAAGRNALLAQLANPTVMSEAPRIFTLNAAWSGPDITSGMFGSEGHDAPGGADRLAQQASELAAISKGAFIYAGDDTIHFTQAIREALDLVALDIPVAGTCCTTDMECQEGVSNAQCKEQLGGFWTSGKCEIDCNMNGRPDTCEIALGLVIDDNANGIPDICECLGDINGDSLVNVDDMLKILSEWNCRDCSETDLNQDGITGIDDLLIALDRWGRCA